MNGNYRKNVSMIAIVFCICFGFGEARGTATKVDLLRELYHDSGNLLKILLIKFVPSLLFKSIASDISSEDIKDLIENLKSYGEELEGLKTGFKTFPDSLLSEEYTSNIEDILSATGYILNAKTRASWKTKSLKGLEGTNGDSALHRARLDFSSLLTLMITREGYPRWHRDLNRIILRHGEILESLRGELRTRKYVEERSQIRIYIKNLPRLLEAVKALGENDKIFKQMGFKFENILTEALNIFRFFLEAFVHIRTNGRDVVKILKDLSERSKSLKEKLEEAKRTMAYGEKDSLDLLDPSEIVSYVTLHDAQSGHIYYFIDSLITTIETGIKLIRGSLDSRSITISAFVLRSPDSASDSPAMYAGDIFTHHVHQASVSIISAIAWGYSQRMNTEVLQETSCTCSKALTSIMNSIINTMWGFLSTSNTAEETHEPPRREPAQLTERDIYRRTVGIVKRDRTEMTYVSHLMKLLHTLQHVYRYYIKYKVIRGREIYAPLIVARTYQGGISPIDLFALRFSHINLQNSRGTYEALWDRAVQRLLFNDPSMPLVGTFVRILSSDIRSTEDERERAEEENSGAVLVTTNAPARNAPRTVLQTVSLVLIELLFPLVETNREQHSFVEELDDDEETEEVKKTEEMEEKEKREEEEAGGPDASGAIAVVGNGSGSGQGTIIVTSPQVTVFPGDGPDPDLDENRQHGFPTNLPAVVGLFDNFYSPRRK
ncbi:MAG: hypothetical protein LBB24_01125 [Rickettsiales bacterium]|jgi:hypothetical protein|nr:hypothetical protein [Rickettsiales bacterium]